MGFDAADADRVLICVIAGRVVGTATVDNYGDRFPRSDWSQARAHNDSCAFCRTHTQHLIASGGSFATANAHTARARRKRSLITCSLIVSFAGAAAALAGSQGGVCQQRGCRPSRPQARRNESELALSLSCCRHHDAAARSALAACQPFLLS